MNTLLFAMLLTVVHPRAVGFIYSVDAEPHSAVAVYQAGTHTFALLYAPLPDKVSYDESMRLTVKSWKCSVIPLANPFISDEKGHFSFCAESRIYEVVLWTAPQSQEPRRRCSGRVKSRGRQ